MGFLKLIAFDALNGVTGYANSVKDEILTDSGIKKQIPNSTLILNELNNKYEDSYTIL